MWLMWLSAAVSRALEKLDDEEEPPAYDFTPDKAKPAKHRSSVEVDELWPAAGAGAVAANESKVPRTVNGTGQGLCAPYR